MNGKKAEFSEALKILIPNLNVYSDYLSRMRKISEHFVVFKKEYPGLFKKI